jgi:hypothetical protein
LKGGPEDIKNNCLDRGSNTGPLDLQSNALPTELSKRICQLAGNLASSLRGDISIF